MLLRNAISFIDVIGDLYATCDFAAWKKTKRNQPEALNSAVGWRWYLQYELKDIAPVGSLNNSIVQVVVRDLTALSSL